MPNIIPYINFAGKGQAAAQFYKTIFGGDFEIQLENERVIQLDFQASDVHFMGSDIEGNPASLVLNCNSEQQLKDFYSQLVDGGKEVFAPADSGWGAIIAHCIDQFGVTWLLNYDQPAS